MPYCNWKPLHALLKLLALVFTLYIISWITNFSIHYHNRQLLYGPLQLINCSVSTIPIQNFCMRYWILQLLPSLLQMKNCMQQWHPQLFQCYGNCWFILALLQLTTFVCPISIVCAIVNSKLFMQYYNSRHHLYVLLQLKMLLQQYCNWQLFIHYHDYWLRTTL